MSLAQTACGRPRAAIEHAFWPPDQIGQSGHRGRQDVRHGCRLTGWSA